MVLDRSSATKQHPVVITATKRRPFVKAALPWLFLLPVIGLNLFVVTGPTFGTLLLSLTNWDGIRPPKFIGLKNYSHMLADPNFYAALSNNFKWLVIFCTIPIIIGLIIAFIVSRVTRGQMFYRTALFLPYIISTVVSGKIWSLLYDPYFGINTLLEKIGFGNPPVWLNDPKTALFDVAVVNAWHDFGFLLVIFLAALHQVDKSLEEAAKVEGAGGMRIFWHVVLPQLRPTLMLILMLTAIGSFTAFDYVYVMTGGGPGNATEVLGTYMYKLALRSEAPGYASTIALAMTFISLIIIAAFGYMRKKGWDI